MWAGLGLLLLIGGAAPAISQTEIKPSFPEWLESVREKGRKRGISEETLNKTLTGLEPNPRILHRSENQTEFTTPFDEYRGYFLTEEMLSDGRNLLIKHDTLIRSIEQKYDVPGEILVAIWGVESRYGSHKSKHDALVALASLGYRHARNSDYFERELLTVLEMLDEETITLPLHGSWAGALGQPQFMPSSYRKYAVDFDGDGDTDIWDSPPDILGSIASYLSRHGWNHEQPWGQRRELQPDSGQLLTPDGASHSYKTTDNFDVLLKYNRSNFYALTVGLLANQLTEEP